MIIGKPIPIDAQVTIMCDMENVRIEVEDKDSIIQFLELTMSPKDFVAALGRRACVPATGVLSGMDKIGLVHENKIWEFPLPDGNRFRDTEAAKKEAKKRCPKGWEPDLYFSSQDSFFRKDGIQWARTNIRRWIPKGESK